MSTVTANVVADSDKRSGTPFHCPTYNVRLSIDRIHSIADLIWPVRELVHVETLESGRSYNNRIYFLHTRVKRDPQNKLGHEHLVLKLNGHYFDELKVMNEVATLLLLHDKASSIPVPSVIAWSCDGKRIETVDGRIEYLEPESLNIPVDFDMTARCGGWIIMTRLPGRSLTDEEVAGQHGQHLMRQIGDYVQQWRTTIELDGQSIGNFRRSDSEIARNLKSTVVESVFLGDRGISITLHGPLLPHQKRVVPLQTALNFYLFKAQDQLKHLEKSPLLSNAPQKEATIAAGYELMHRIMPSMQCWKQIRPNRAVLSHMDLSSRNILVEPDPSDPTSLHITGIVDWEFAGLMPEVEE